MEGPLDIDCSATIGRPLARPPRVGDVVANKYRLRRVLGRGGMGRIFEADHLVLQNVVALKFMHPHLCRDERALRRFAREARSAAHLRSDHAVRILDVDRHEGGAPYIVMEKLEGSSLDKLVGKGKRLDVGDAVDYAIQTCDALAEAHARKIIHRDIKPENLFLARGKSERCIIKVLDFGLAKAEEIDGVATGGNEAQRALGSPQYMSPEQVRGAKDLDARTDIWSLGVTLYELLTGSAPFGGPNVAVVFASITHGEPLPLRSVRPDVPRAVADVVHRCLAKDRAARYATAMELADALHAASNRRPVPPPPPRRVAPTSVRGDAPTELAVLVAPRGRTASSGSCGPLAPMRAPEPSTPPVVMPTALAMETVKVERRASGRWPLSTTLFTLAGTAIIACVTVIAILQPRSAEADPRHAGSPTQASDVLVTPARSSPSTSAAVVSAEPVPPPTGAQSAASAKPAPRPRRQSAPSKRGPNHPTP